MIKKDKERFLSIVTPEFLTLSVASREISSICSEGDGTCLVILLLPNKITSFFSSFNFKLLTFIQVLTSAMQCSNLFIKSESSFG